MIRSERWSTASEILHRFRDSQNPEQGAGPVLFFENGRRYTDESEAHIEVIGSTGTGKTQCCVLPFERECYLHGESLIILDPKEESKNRNHCFLPKDYIEYCVNFRDPRRSKTKWNPLEAPKRLFRSRDPNDKDIASSMISEFWNGVYPYEGNTDRFWPESAANYAKGLTYGLCEKAGANQVTLNNVAIMMEQSEARKAARYRQSTLIQEFDATLESDSLAKRNLAPYVTAPNETRASIHSVASSGLEIFSRSRGLMEMLSEDTLNILDIDVDKPFVLRILLPDETDVYDSLAGLLVSQVTQHLIRVAQERGGKLPIRVNIILEELGSIGRSIPNLPNLMVASRSRNMRLMLVLQSHTQLIDVYGKSKAETINSCVGITIGFSTNNWQTLQEWSQRCGDREVETCGRVVKEPLITPAQLAAMPTGTALIMADRKYKFITHLPFYNEMYDNSSWRKPKEEEMKTGKPLKSFSFEALINRAKRMQVCEGKEDILDMLPYDFARRNMTQSVERRDRDIREKEDENMDEIDKTQQEINELLRNLGLDKDVDITEEE